MANDANDKIRVSHLQEGHRGPATPAPKIAVSKEPVSAVPPAPAPQK